MNKSILQRCGLLILMLMATMAASADRIYFNPDVIKVNTGTYNPEYGFEVNIAIALENSQPIHGFQVCVNRGWFDLADCWLSSRADDSYQLVSSVNNDNGTFTIGAFSTNNTPLTGKDGDLLHIKLTLSGSDNWETIGIYSALLVTTGDVEFEPNIGPSLQIQPLKSISWIGITPEEVSMPVGMNPPCRLEYSYQPSDATATAVTWSSSDTSVAYVDNEGFVSGIAPGEAIITVTAESGVKAECHVTVYPVEISWIGITPEEISMPVGMNPPYRLEYYYQPDDSTATAVTWSSSDTDVATVTEEGFVLGIAPGEAIITVTAESGVKAECHVTVLPIEVSGLTLSHHSAELKANETLQLTATVEPEDATDKTVTWASSNEAVATVDAEGNVTAITVGEATITATAGEVQAECLITVVATPVETAYITNGNLDMTVGSSVELSVTILPLDATDRSVVWSSSDTIVARVDANGLVEALSAGEAHISALFSNDSTSTITVTVLNPHAESIGLSETSIEAEVGATIQLTVTILPAEAAGQDLAWASSNPAVATVDSTGLVTIVGPGEAEISVTTTDGSLLSATCSVKGQSITGVDAVFTDETVSADVYTVGGLLVKTRASKADFMRLSPGVYIVNGKKVVNF